MADMNDLYRSLLNNNGLDNYIPPVQASPSVSVNASSNAFPTFDPSSFNNANNAAQTLANAPKASVVPNPMAAPSIFNPQTDETSPIMPLASPMLDQASMMRALQAMQGNYSKGNNNMTNVSDDLASRVAGLEGFTPKAQWDFRQDTNGYGTKALYPGEVIDRDEATKRLTTELGNAQAAVEKNVDVSKLPSGVVDALTSATYNLGAGAMGQLYKTAMDCASTGDFAPLADRFKLYNKAGGKINQGLVNRRNAETSWFMDNGSDNDDNS